MLCGNLFENLFLNASGVTKKKATIIHVCSKCGQKDEIEVAVASGGVNANFGSSPSGFLTQCPWNQENK
jgi:transcription elongation factor Elf1